MTAEVEPQLSDAIEVACMRHRVETRTAIPGTVLAYAAGPPESCRIRLGFRRVLTDGQEIEMPEVAEVPICWPGAAGFTVSAELQVGDEVLCIVADRALDAWLDNGGATTPSGGRLHDVSDIVAIPGLRSAGKAVRVRRGRETLYLGKDDGQAPWAKLEARPTPTVTVEGTTIKLGAAATLGVARLNDSIAVTDAAWLTWFASIGTALMVPPPPSAPTGIITGASSKVKAE